MQDLDELRQHFGLKKVILVAHSYGPLLAGSYAIAHPGAVSKMVLFGPVPPRRGDFWQRFGKSVNARLDSTQRRKQSEWTLRQIQRDQRQGCRDYWAIGMIPRLAEPERTLPLIKSDLCASDLEGIRYGNRIGNHVIMNSYGDWDLRPQLKSLAIPTLAVVHGEQESIPMDMVEEWVTSLPNAHLMKVPRAAHFTYAERPELVWPAVERFLSGGGWGHRHRIVDHTAGFLAGKIMNGSGYGIFIDLLLGLLGGVVGRFVLSLVGIGAWGLVGSILIATFGAVMLIWVVRQVRGGRTV